MDFDDEWSICRVFGLYQWCKQHCRYVVEPGRRNFNGGRSLHGACQSQYAADHYNHGPKRSRPDQNSERHDSTDSNRFRFAESGEHHPNWWPIDCDEPCGAWNLQHWPELDAVAASRNVVEWSLHRSVADCVRAIRDGNGREPGVYRNDRQRDSLAGSRIGIRESCDGILERGTNSKLHPEREWHRQYRGDMELVACGGVDFKWYLYSAIFGGYGAVGNRSSHQQRG